MNRAEDLFVVVCRPALPVDTPQALELSSKIWGGEDYVPYVWEDWLQDPEGQLAVAEYGGRVVGFGKLSRLAPCDWWLQGLRVDPAYRGRRIASKLHSYLMAHWRQHCSGVLRFSTSTQNLASQHLAEISGFTKIGSYTYFSAPALTGEAAGFSPVTVDQIPEAFQFLLASASLQLSFGLMEFDWLWVRPQKDQLAEAVSDERVWWRRDRQGLFFVFSDDEDDQSVLILQSIGCRVEDLKEGLLDFRRLAGSLGFDKAGWNVPLLYETEAAVVEAGYTRVWDDAMLLYEKPHDQDCSNV
jgi:GNAT superfamily N-acetyltransferase